MLCRVIHHRRWWQLWKPRTWSVWVEAELSEWDRAQLGEAVIEKVAEKGYQLVLSADVGTFPTMR